MDLACDQPWHWSFLSELLAVQGPFPEEKPELHRSESRGPQSFHAICDGQTRSFSLRMQNLFKHACSDGDVRQG